MTGAEAIIELLKGQKIRRKIWNDHSHWFLKNNKLTNEANITFNMTFNELIMGDDWEIYDERVNSVMALEALKNGKKISDIYWGENKYLKMVDNVIMNQDNIKTSISFSNIDEKCWIVYGD